jgi:hypothetical protein
MTAISGAEALTEVGRTQTEDARQRYARLAADPVKGAVDKIGATVTAALYATSQPSTTSRGHTSCASRKPKVVNSTYKSVSLAPCQRDEVQSSTCKSGMWLKSSRFRDSRVVHIPRESWLLAIFSEH